jgi:hypothetical protein
VGTEDGQGLQDKVLELPPYKNPLGFHFCMVFPMISPSPIFVAFVSSNVFILFSPKILKSNLVFVRIFYFKSFQFFQKFKFHHLVYQNR